jgi:hypothetical protein
MKKLILTVLLITAVSFNSFAQRKIVHLPDLPGYVTIKCDFHLHTVMSDGYVWPTVRVDEALRDGLDAIAITDHVDWTPHKDYIPVDHNSAWKIADEYARDKNILVVHGAEIARKMPPGHINALFIQDASVLISDSIFSALQIAKEQGAFIEWNHPGWKGQQPDGIPRIYDIHYRLIKAGLLNGIEMNNNSSYIGTVMNWCLQNNLTMVYNSDAHGVISRRNPPENRSMTLVFAKERTLDALKKALFAGHTLSYFNNSIAGKEEFAKPFFYQCISVAKPFYQDDKNIYFEVINKSDVPFNLVNGIADAPASITLDANEATTVVLSKKVTSPLVYDVGNVIIGENKMLKIELKYK